MIHCIVLILQLNRFVSPCLQLKDLQDKYSECEDMLHEAREDIKNLRNKSLPNSTVQRYTALASVLPMDSLAAEIEGTFRKGLDTPAPSEYKWVCDFVRVLSYVEDFSWISLNHSISSYIKFSLH